MRKYQGELGDKELGKPLHNIAYGILDSPTGCSFMSMTLTSIPLTLTWKTGLATAQVPEWPVGRAKAEPSELHCKGFENRTDIGTTAQTKPVKIWLKSNCLFK